MLKIPSTMLPGGNNDWRINTSETLGGEGGFGAPRRKLRFWPK
jgi:hypothetical protein